MGHCPVQHVMLSDFSIRVLPDTSMTILFPTNTQPREAAVHPHPTPQEAVGNKLGQLLINRFGSQWFL